MIETLYRANGLDETRVRRAFGWVITFRDFPIGSFQTVDGDSMMTEALTLFTKGRAEFYLNGERRGDRVPGTLSSEHELVGLGGQFELRYVEPTTRVCIPNNINRGKLPRVSKLMIEKGSLIPLDGNFLVCLGSLEVNGKVVEEEKTFKTLERRIGRALQDCILLEFQREAS